MVIPKANAYVMVVDDETAIAGASTYDFPSGNLITPNPLTLGYFTISFDPGWTNCSFFGGFCGFNTSTFPDISPMVIDFSNPIAGFGVNFWHTSNPADLSGQAVLALYDGANATGNLLGLALDDGLAGTGSSSGFDFVGIWSDEVNIRSAVVAGAGTSQGYAVDAIQFSFTTYRVPEPSTMALFVLGLAGMAGYRILNSRRLTNRGHLLRA